MNKKEEAKKIVAKLIGDNRCSCGGKWVSVNLKATEDGKSFIYHYYCDDCLIMHQSITAINYAIQGEDNEQGRGDREDS